MKKTLIAAILIFAVAPLFSQDLESMGYSILSTRTEDGYNVITAKDPNTGLTFDLFYKNFTQAQLYFLQEARKIILSWEYLIPEELQILLQPDYVEIRVFPEAFRYEDKDYAEYIPSALNFYYDEVLEYDFRILVENITLRIQGPYFNEEQLAGKLKSAVDNPFAYIQTHDPEHIVRRLGEISDLIEKLKAETNKLSSELQEVTELNETLSKRYTLLKLGIIAVTNQGLFSSIKDFNKEGIEKAIELKEQNPNYTEEDLITACKEAGLKISKKEIHIIFMVYFNEF